MRIERVACESAEDLLDQLSPRGRWFVDSGRRDWLFRGHSHVRRYKLVPSALRPGGELSLLLGGPRLESNRDQINAEVRLSRDFFWTADGAGLALPEDSQDLRRELARWDDLEFVSRHFLEWPPSGLLSLIALAQHHGLPTRLLDWTRNRHAACYFAAREAAANSPEPAQELSVWCFNLEGYRFHSLARSLRREQAPQRIEWEIEFVTAPAASNENLRAQGGVFTLCRPSRMELDGKILREPLEDIIEGFRGDGLPGARLEQRRKAPLVVEDLIVLLCFTLPAREGGRLLRLLAREDVDAARLFPGYSGVVDSLRERLLWRV